MRHVSTVTCQAYCQNNVDCVFDEASRGCGKSPMNIFSRGWHTATHISNSRMNQPRGWFSENCKYFLAWRVLHYKKIIIQPLDLTNKLWIKLIWNRYLLVPFVVGSDCFIETWVFPTILTSCSIKCNCCDTCLSNTIWIHWHLPEQNNIIVFSIKVLLLQVL